ncbi:hypothetical protein WD019_18235 [Fictibacillus sp. Mic-4]|uniref:hypothetical protein n=1 Tax=Fictibacillus TaxID=1329200 RepID=UPI000406661A|nr:hypothetical protein [Fictibacillus gelatini]
MCQKKKGKKRICHHPKCSGTSKEKEVIYVRPVIHINREHVIYVPRHVEVEETINEVIDTGEPGKCDFHDNQKKCKKKKKRNCCCCKKKR